MLHGVAEVRQITYFKLGRMYSAGSSNIIVSNVRKRLVKESGGTMRRNAKHVARA